MGLRRFLHRRPGPAAAESPPPPVTGQLIPIESIGFAGRLHPRIDSACEAGMANRLRCLLTSALFSEQPPTLYWPANAYDHPLHHQVNRDASDIFALNVIPLERGSKPPEGSAYNSDWHLLSPEIMQLPGDSRSFCIDALNGDGLKDAAMLYLLPDRIFDSFRHQLHQLLNPAFQQRITRLVATCRERHYAIFTLRYWVDCERSLSLDNPESRPISNWADSDAFRQYLNIICMQKRWTRNPPSLSAFRSARRFLNEQGIDDILFCSDRWFRSNIADRHGSIQQALSDFQAGPERWLATLFVIANARVICRSKDSTYTQLPPLLNEKWSARILNL